MSGGSVGLGRVTVGLLAALVAWSGCKPAEVEQHTPFDELAGPEAAVAVHGTSPRPEPPSLAALRSEPVMGRTGPGGEPFEVVVREPGRAGQDRWFGRKVFAIALRSDQPVASPCSSCHRPGQEALRPEGRQNAHRNLLPRHPDRGGSQCRTCHAPGNVEQLQLLDGSRVPLAHAYALCGQCHYIQADAWAAGVHGKRLDAWQGRRVVLGCADCHDPHQPAVRSRNPYPGPTLPAREGRASHEP